MELAYGRPRSTVGRWSVLLALTFMVFLAASVLWSLHSSNPHGGFWGDPVEAYLTIAAAVTGLASGAASMIGITRKHERSLLLFATFFLGLIVMVMVGSEIAAAILFGR
jgi:hypothetical protein